MSETPEEKKARMLHPLKIDGPRGFQRDSDKWSYLTVLSNLAIAQSNLISRHGHDKAWPHYVALCKEIERVGGFTYAPFEE